MAISHKVCMEREKQKYIDRVYELGGKLEVIEDIMVFICSCKEDELGELWEKMEWIRKMT